MPCTAVASGVADPLDRPATVTRNAARSFLLGVATAGERVVAVGERGIIVLSDDKGKSWRQAKVPTSVELTAVEFPTPKQGWAVGHGGIVLHTEDGGETWVRQLDGKAAAQLALDAAQANAARLRPNDERGQRQLADAQRLVEEGADKPFLDLHFENEQQGFIVGAYGLMFRTEDGGKTWKSWMDRLDNPMGYNIYAIRVVGNNVYLAGEKGLFLRSTDKGNSFKKLTTPYDGTFFNIAVFPQGEIVLAGLRGNAYRSADQGKTFTKVNVPVAISFSASTTLPDGTAIFANQEGAVLETRDHGHTMKLLRAAVMRSLTAITPVREGELLAVGSEGTAQIALPSAPAAPRTQTGSVQ
ncbi:MAG: WD40/YVTN/BNR-like repeat-containing protein [Terriglobales bacterium]